MSVPEPVGAQVTALEADKFVAPALARQSLLASLLGSLFLAPFEKIRDRLLYWQYFFALSITLMQMLHYNT